MTRRCLGMQVSGDPCITHPPTAPRDPGVQGPVSPTRRPPPCTPGSRDPCVSPPSTQGPRHLGSHVTPPTTTTQRPSFPAPPSRTPPPQGPPPPASAGTQPSGWPPPSLSPHSRTWHRPRHLGSSVTPPQHPEVSVTPPASRGRVSPLHPHAPHCPRDPPNATGTLPSRCPPPPASPLPGTWHGAGVRGPMSPPPPQHPGVWGPLCHPPQHPNTQFPHSTPTHPTTPGTPSLPQGPLLLPKAPSYPGAPPASPPTPGPGTDPGVQLPPPPNTPSPHFWGVWGHPGSWGGGAARAPWGGWWGGAGGPPQTPPLH